MEKALHIPRGPLGLWQCFFLHELLIKKLAMPWSVVLLGMLFERLQKEEINWSTYVNLLVNEITLRNKIFSLANKTLDLLEHFELLTLDFPLCFLGASSGLHCDSIASLCHPPGEKIFLSAQMKN